MGVVVNHPKDIKNHRNYRFISLRRLSEGKNMKQPVDIIIDLMEETQEQTIQRRKDNAERREEEKSDRQRAHEDSGMCESDFY